MQLKEPSLTGAGPCSGEVPHLMVKRFCFALFFLKQGLGVGLELTATLPRVLDGRIICTM